MYNSFTGKFKTLSYCENSIEIIWKMVRKPISELLPMQLRCYRIFPEKHGNFLAETQKNRVWKGFKFSSDFWNNRGIFE